MAKEESTTTTTVRLPVELAAELAAVARADGQTISGANRDAIAKHIAERTSDPYFQKRVKEVLEEDMRIVKRLARRLDE